MAFAILCFREEVSIRALLLLLIWDWLILMESNPDMNDELTNLIWDCERTRFDCRCGRTCSGWWIFLELREWEREMWCGLDMDGRGGHSGMKFGCTKSGPRVLRVSSIMNPPVEISDINTNSFGMSMRAENSLS